MTPASKVEEQILIQKFTEMPLQELVNYEFIENLKCSPANGAVISFFRQKNSNIFAYILAEITSLNKKSELFENKYRIQLLEEMYKIFLKCASFRDLIPQDYPEFILSYIETVNKYNFLDEKDIGTCTIDKLYVCSIDDPTYFISNTFLHKKIMSIITKIIKEGKAQILPQSLCNISFFYFIKAIPKIIAVVGLDKILDFIDRIMSASSEQLSEKRKVLKETLSQTPNIFDEINYKLQNNQLINEEFIQLIKECIVDNFGYLTELVNINNNNIQSLLSICKKLTIYIPYTHVIPYNTIEKAHKSKRHTETNISIMQKILDENLIETIDENILPGKNPVILAACYHDFAMIEYLFKKINYSSLDLFTCHKTQDEIWGTYWDTCGEPNNYVLYFIFHYLAKDNISFYNRRTLEKYIMPFICKIPSVLKHIDSNIIQYMNRNTCSNANSVIGQLFDTIKYHDINFKYASHAFRYWLDLLNTKAKRGNAFNNIDNNAHRNDTYSYIKQEIHNKEGDLNNIKNLSYPDLPPDSNVQHTRLMQQARLVLLKYYLDNKPATDTKYYSTWQELVALTKSEELINKYKNSQYGIPFKDFAAFAQSNALIQEAIKHPRKDSKNTEELSEIPRLILAEIGGNEDISMFSTWDVDLDGNILTNEAASTLNIEEIKDLNSVYSCAILLITQDIDKMLENASIQEIIGFLKPLIDKKAIDLRIKLLQLFKNNEQNIPEEMYCQIKDILLLQQQLMQAYFVNCLSEIRQDNSCIVGRISRVTLKVIMLHYLFARISPEMHIEKYFFDKWRTVAQKSISTFLLERLELKLTLKQNSFKFLSTYPESITLTPEVYLAINKIIASKPQSILAINQQLTTFNAQLQMILKAIMFPHKNKSLFNLRDDRMLCILFDTIFTLNQNNLPELFARHQIIKASAGNKAKYEQDEYLNLFSIDIAPYNRNDFIAENFHDGIQELKDNLITNGQILNENDDYYRSYIALNTNVGINEIACKEIANNVLSDLNNLALLPLDNIITTYQTAINLLNVNNNYCLTNFFSHKIDNRFHAKQNILIKQHSSNIANALFASLNQCIKLSTHPELQALIKDKCQSKIRTIFSKILNDEINKTILMNELYKCNTFEDFFNSLSPFISKDTIEYNELNEFHALIKKAIQSMQEISKFNDILINIAQNKTYSPIKINELKNIFIRIQNIEHNSIPDNLLLEQIFDKVINSEELSNFTAKIKNFYCPTHFTHEFNELCSRLHINIEKTNVSLQLHSSINIPTINF